MQHPNPHCAQFSSVIRKQQGVGMDEKKTKKCIRPGCECPAAEGSKYCSPECQSVSIDRLTSACNCGHSECTGKETVGAAG